jgi:orotidine-5'-phosphate decarboxylase
MLTSLDQNDLRESGIMCDEVSYVEKLVKIGVSSGIDGIVSSPQEVKLLRKKFEKLILVTPGIRLPDDNKNDQKRIETPGRAIKNGSSMLIIGRTITQSTNPILSIEKIIRNIENEI